jgi:transcription elongation factor GreA
MTERIPMTQAGFDSMKAERKQLTEIDRPEIIGEIARARALGDLSENAEYHAAKERQGHTETRIQQLEDRMQRAEVIHPEKLSGKSVKFGATLSLEDEDSGEKFSYKLVGEFESDAKNGRISITSPLARALIGKQKGDSVHVSIPSGERNYEILKVQFKKIT